MVIEGRRGRVALADFATHHVAKDRYNTKQLFKLSFVRFASATGWYRQRLLDQFRPLENLVPHVGTAADKRLTKLVGRRVFLKFIYLFARLVEIVWTLRVIL